MQTLALAACGVWRNPRQSATRETILPILPSSWLIPHNPNLSYFLCLHAYSPMSSRRPASTRCTGARYASSTSVHGKVSGTPIPAARCTKSPCVTVFALLQAYSAANGGTSSPHSTTQDESCSGRAFVPLVLRIDKPKPAIDNRSRFVSTTSCCPWCIRHSFDRLFLTFSPPLHNDQLPDLSNAHLYFTQ